jgi:hypothetical protein
MEQSVSNPASDLVFVYQPERFVDSTCRKKSLNKDGRVGYCKELDRASLQEVERLRKAEPMAQKENERLKEEAERLRRELEAALRASKRQAAPHSLGEPQASSKRSGRDYGRQACRPIPVAGG